LVSSELEPVQFRPDRASHQSGRCHRRLRGVHENSDANSPAAGRNRAGAPGLIAPSLAAPRGHLPGESLPATSLSTMATGPA